MLPLLPLIPASQPLSTLHDQSPHQLQWLQLYLLRHTPTPPLIVQPASSTPPPSHLTSSPATTAALDSHHSPLPAVTDRTQPSAVANHTQLSAVTAVEKMRERFEEFVAIFSSSPVHADLVQRLNGPIHTQEEGRGGSQGSSTVKPEAFAGFPEPELIHLLEVAGVELQARWRMVGVGLGMSQPTLDAIQQTHRGSVGFGLECMTQVFTTWHNGATSEYSWKRLAEVMCSPILNQQRLLPEMHEKVTILYK